MSGSDTERQSRTILERPEPGIAVIRLNRPEARNALDLPLRRELAQRFTDLALDDELRCVVLTGGPEVFAAGADIKFLSGVGPVDLMLCRLEKLWAPIKDFPRPLIAAVNGYALGGGCELAMHADIIVAGRSAQFGQPEVRLGIMPGAGGTQRLPRAVGRFKAMKLLLTGRPIPAEEAERMGLVTEVVDDGQVLPRALELAREIAAQPRLAVEKIKEAVLAGYDLPLEQALLVERQAFQFLFGSADRTEGMAAFLERRKPNFTGR